MTTDPELPPDLAPALRERWLQFLAEVTPTSHPPFQPPRSDPNTPRCTFCHTTGKVGGHHLADGTVVWAHKRCHRRHHHAGKHPRRGKQHDQ